MYLVIKLLNLNLCHLDAIRKAKKTNTFAHTMGSGLQANSGTRPVLPTTKVTFRAHKFCFTADLLSSSLEVGGPVAPTSRSCPMDMHSAKNILNLEYRHFSLQLSYKDIWAAPEAPNDGFASASSTAETCLRKRKYISKNLITSLA